MPLPIRAIINDTAPNDAFRLSCGAYEVVSPEQSLHHDGNFSFEKQTGRP
ncbi:UNVERIFIED_ORG: hypothetical protein GGD48_005882 [Rhizobium etli]|nr:hypothetical protein [Rhizobium sophoriradicis]